MQSILITGSRGFIGSGLPGDGIDLKDGGDIRVYKAAKDYDVVIHTAALTSVVESEVRPNEYISTNMIGTVNMIRQHPNAFFIYLSTAAIYGEGEDHTIASIPHPSSVYAITKYSGEIAVMYLKNWAILRLTNVIGEGERGEPNVYQVFKKSDVLPIYGDGLQTRDFIDVEQVRKTIMWSIGKPGIYNVGSGVSKTILDVAKEFGKPMKFLPERQGEIRHFGIKDAVNIGS